MYLSARAARMRNLGLAGVNGAVTLVILLIAPLGLAAVIINTVLVTIATYATATMSDRMIRSLSAERRMEMDRGRSEVERRDRDDLSQF